MRIDDLSRSEVPELMRQVRQPGLATDLFATSMTRGQLRIGGTAVLLVDSSGGIVVHGSINGDGTLTWTGTTNLNGPLNVSGLTTLLSNLVVGSGGKITVNGMTIGTLGSGIGGITWGTTFPSLYSDSSSVAIGAGSNQYVSAGTGGPAMVNGSRVYAIDSTSHQVVGAATTTSAANVYLDSSTGRLYRVTSARRFKIKPRKMELAPALLDVPVKEWIDRGARKRGEPDVYVPGVIAEEVEAAGGGQFVTHGPDGEVEGVAYERLALARTQILAEKLTETNKKLDLAMGLIAELTRRLDAA